MATLSSASHLDDLDGELSNLKWDKVIFRTKTDCSLDKNPHVRVDLAISKDHVADFYIYYIGQGLLGEGIPDVYRYANLRLRW